jgi:hypothetical protein
LPLFLRCTAEKCHSKEDHIACERFTLTHCVTAAL